MLLGAFFNNLLRVLKNSSDLLGTIEPPDVAVSPSGFNVDSFVSKMLTFLIVVTVVLAVAMIIWAGFLYVTSSGDEGKIKKAQQIITYTVIGIAVALIAGFVITLVFKFITGKSLPESLLS